MLRAYWQRIPALMIAVVLGAALVACGNMDSGAPATGGFSDEVLPNQIAVNADPKGTLRWELQAYEGKAGDVTFVVKNPSTIAHNFVIEGNGVKVSSKTIGAKKSQNLTLKGLAAGEYQIICTLPGHREAGMVAKLTLK